MFCSISSSFTSHHIIYKCEWIWSCCCCCFTNPLTLNLLQSSCTFLRAHTGNLCFFFSFYKPVTIQHSIHLQDVVYFTVNVSMVSIRRRWMKSAKSFMKEKLFICTPNTLIFMPIHAYLFVYLFTCSFFYSCSHVRTFVYIVQLIVFGCCRCARNSHWIFHNRIYRCPFSL